MFAETLVSDILQRERHLALQDYSKEHREVIKFCRKIREGLFEEVDLKQLVKYCQSFYHDFLSEHFDREEKLIFPKLPVYHPAVIDLKNDHIRIERIFINMSNMVDTIRQIRLLALELEAHVLYEEKSFFHFLQKNIPDHVLTTMRHPSGTLEAKVKFELLE